MNKPKDIEELSQFETSFMFKVYEESWAQARHVDEYMERVPRFFLIVVGAVVAATAAVIQLSELSSFTFLLGGIGLFVLAWIGFVASLTIPRYRVIRNSYFNAIYLIHKYFTDKADGLEKYLGLQIGGTFKGYRHPLRVDFFRFIMMVIMDSSLFATGVYVMQNAKTLTDQLYITMSWQWALPVVVFILFHVSMYFLIIGYYQPKKETGDTRKQSHPG